MTGVCRLTGHVQNDLAKDRAEKWSKTEPDTRRHRRAKCIHAEECSVSLVFFCTPLQHSLQVLCLLVFDLAPAKEHLWCKVQHTIAHADDEKINSKWSA